MGSSHGWHRHQNHHHQEQPQPQPQLCCRRHRHIYDHDRHRHIYDHHRSLARSQQASEEEVVVVTKGRHDPCVGIRAVPIAEAMMALVLMDHYLRHKAQNMSVRL